MEQQTMLKEILHALNVHSEKIDKRFDQVDIRMNEMDTKFNKMNTRIDKMSTRIDNMESKMDKRFDRLEKRLDGMRVELTQTQETADCVLSKTTKHKKKLHQLNKQQTMDEENPEDTTKNYTNVTNDINATSLLNMMIGIEIIYYQHQLSLNNATFYISFKALRL